MRLGVVGQSTPILRGDKVYRLVADFATSGVSSLAKIVARSLAAFGPRDETPKIGSGADFEIDLTLNTNLVNSSDARAEHLVLPPPPPLSPWATSPPRTPRPWPGRSNPASCSNGPHLPRGVLLPLTTILNPRTTNLIHRSGVPPHRGDERAVVSVPELHSLVETRGRHPPPVRENRTWL